MHTQYAKCKPEVSEELAPHARWAGNPAREVRERSRSAPAVVKFPLVAGGSLVLRH
jgi:hypothetical protein